MNGMHMFVRYKDKGIFQGVALSSAHTSEKGPEGRQVVSFICPSTNVDRIWGI